MHDQLINGILFPLKKHILFAKKVKGKIKKSVSHLYWFNEYINLDG